MKFTITFAQQQFLELLRAGLWGKPADPDQFPIGATDWKEIFRIAKEQTVQVIIADGIESLPQENWPPKEALMRLLMVRVKTSQMHTLLNTTLCQVVNALNAEGIPSVLLKGQGVAQNYRNPESRMCGDIDLYVGRENFEKASDAICRLDPTQIIEEIEHDALHRNFEINGASLELHQKTTNSANRRQGRLIDIWTQECIDRHFNSSSLPSVRIGQSTICTPSENFDAVFILHHAVRHLVTEGVSLRQVCDWAMYLYRHHSRINEDELRETLNRFHMTTIWNEFSILAVNILGLEPQYIPLAPRAFDSKKTELFLENIFATGNFGHYDKNGRNPKESNVIKRKWRSLCVQTLRFIKISRLFPRFVLSYSIGWYPSSIARLFKK